MMELLIDMFDDTAEIFVSNDEALYAKLLEKEHRMDEMESSARQDHYTRMVNGECTSHVASSVFCDILSTIERMADHCCNTAKSSVTGLTSDLSDDEVTAPAAA